MNHLMEFLKVVADENQFFTDCWISVDRKLLHLSYLDSKIEYDDFFDQLDLEEHTYDKVEKMVFETDFYYEIPTNVSKFKNLKKLTVMGSRFWNLALTQVPDCVETLVLTDHTNLQAHCIDGMEKLINLVEIQLDMKPFFFSDIFDYPCARRSGGKDNDNDNNGQILTIPCLHGLKKISFHTSISYQREDLVPGWKRLFKNNRLFTKIKERIALINLNEHDVFPIIEMTLADK